MSSKLLHKIIGAGVFFVSALVYFLTVQPTVSFWDCGEFIASAVNMQVPHPPGTPFFLIIGRLFSLIPFAENLAFRVNAVSVLSSALTVLFLYFVAVKLIENYKQEGHKSVFDSFLTYISAAVGALSLAFADTFWFNAVEAEVYAMSVFFIGFVTWLIMLWHQKADEDDNEKWILLIAYLIGLSLGVHLMAVLSALPIVMIIMFRKYITNDEKLKSSAYVFLGHSALLTVFAMIMWATQNESNPVNRDVYLAFDTKMKMFFVLISAVYVVVFRKNVFNKNSFYIPIIIGGITLASIYPGIVKILPSQVANISGNNTTLNFVLIAAIIAIVGFVVYWSRKNNKETLNLIAKGFMFVFIGYTSYAMIPIRANQDTPINLNSPKSATELVSYLNREQYGDFPTFKRRYTSEPHQMVVYNNYSSDLSFWWNYQMDHMFNRYLMWNYIGRPSTIQDAGVDWSQLYGLPFLIGIFGLLYHFKRDWKMASIFFVMFVFLGYLTAFYQNQQQPQPRERDYFYVGAFFVFSIWVAIGVRGIVDVLMGYFKESTIVKPVSVVAVLFFFMFVPVNMLWSNYFTHDRSNNYVPWDYAYNLLQSVEEDAIIFTNGDNDTFPLWYLQDVEGVRRDVRIANLSLLNTEWYLLQLKNTTPYDTERLPFSFTDDEIRRLAPGSWETRRMEVAVPDKVYDEFGTPDSLRTGTVRWNLKPTANFGTYNILRVQDLAALDMIQTNQWKRPIYFAVTVSDNSRIGLDDYLRMEGLALRVTPEAEADYFARINPKRLGDQIFNEPESYSREYQRGFKFRGLRDSTIFFDENHQRLTQNYRNSFVRYALYMMTVENNNAEAIRALDEMEKKIPKENIIMDYRLVYDVGNLYHEAGAIDKFNKNSEYLEDILWNMIEENPNYINDKYSPYYLLQNIFTKQQRWDKLVTLFQKLKEVVPNDRTIDMYINEYRKKMEVDQKLEKPDNK